MTKVNEDYFSAAVKSIHNLSHYYESLNGDVVAYLKHYFPDACEDELCDAVKQAILLVFDDG